VSQPARHPYRLAPSRQLVTATVERHIADLVRLVLLTGTSERLHHPDFGAGLGAASLFEPLDPALLSALEVRARGSLQRALGDRIQLQDLRIARAGESTITASLTYELRPAGTTATVEVVITP
jgi:phage baseplate assembly protein W